MRIWGAVLIEQFSDWVSGELDPSQGRRQTFTDSFFLLFIFFYWLPPVSSSSHTTLLTLKFLPPRFGSFRQLNPLAIFPSYDTIDWESEELLLHVIGSSVEQASKLMIVSPKSIEGKWFWFKKDQTQLKDGNARKLSRSLKELPFSIPHHSHFVLREEESFFFTLWINRRLLFTDLILTTITAGHLVTFLSSSQIYFSL
jgi:hypothetical protein